MKISSELKAFISRHKDDDIHALALRIGNADLIDIQMVIRQILGRRLAKNKLPEWYRNEDVIYPISLSMEQCSSEQTGRFKANLVSGQTMIDLTGGFGVDTAYFSHNFSQVAYVEQQAELVDIASHNFKMLGLNTISTHNCDALEFLTATLPVDFIYIDPARRNDLGRKTMLIEDCVPNIIDIQNKLSEKATQVMIKLSPMLDISKALKSLKNVSHLYVVSVHNECKELLILKQHDFSDKPLLHCVNLQNDKVDEFSFYKEDEEIMQIEYSSQIAKYLYEPNSSLLKAGAFKIVANRYNLQKLHPSSHLYTSDVYDADFQGRKFEVIDICTLNKKELKNHLNGISKANISTRNFPLSPEELKKKIGLKDGGDLYIFGTTLSNEKKVLVLCHKIS